MLKKIILILTLTATSLVAAKYEYVRLTSGMSFELSAGDVATVVGFSVGRSGGRDDRVMLFKVGGVTYKYRFAETDGYDYFTAPKHVLVGAGEVSYEESGMVTFRIERASDSGSKTLAWNGNAWEGGDDDTQQASNNNSPVPNPAQIQYDQLLGWCWFTQYPWVYSYTNGSWYYLRGTSDGLYAWNANLPNSKWIKLFG